MRQPQDPTSAIRWLPFLHTEDSVIPPFAVMRVTGYDSDTGYYSVARPNAASMTEILINGPSAIAPYGEGQGHCSDPCTALYEPNDGTPANGEDWGTASGSWKLAKDNTGFRVLGNAANGTAEFRFLGVAYKELSTTGDLASPWKFVVVDAATTAAETLADLVAGYSLDGVTLATTMYILVKDQSSQSQNGIYLVSASAPVRVSYWFDATAEDTLSVTAALLGLPGVLVQVNQGTANAGTLWRCNYTPGNTLGTDAVVFVQVKPVPAGGTTGQVLAKQSNTNFDVDWDDAATTYTDEQAQDAVGAMIDDTDTVTLAYVDGTPSLTATVRYQHSITSDASGLKLSGDAASPTSGYFYGVLSGTKGWYSLNNLGGAQWVLVATLSYTNFSDASTSKTVTAYTVNAKVYMMGWVVKHSVAFGGGGLSAYSFDIGRTGSTTAYQTAYDVFVAPSDTGIPGATGLGTNDGLRAFSSGSWDFTLTANSGGGNLNAATAGQVLVYLLLGQLPT